GKSDQLALPDHLDRAQVAAQASRWHGDLGRRPTGLSDHLGSHPRHLLPRIAISVPRIRSVAEASASRMGAPGGARNTWSGAGLAPFTGGMGPPSSANSSGTNRSPPATANVTAPSCTA